MIPKDRARKEIEVLMRAAAEAGDDDTVQACVDALSGDVHARMLCASLLDAGEAMIDKCGWSEP